MPKIMQIECSAERPMERLRKRGMQVLAVCALACASIVQVQAQDALPFDPRTGDGWVDTALSSINAYAARYHNAFVDELVRYQSVPRALAEDELEGGASAADVYYACAVAQALGRPCRELLIARGSDLTVGWKDVVDRVDAGAAGEARARVKRGIVESHRRWARPITLDASLRRAFPERVSGDH